MYHNLNVSRTELELQQDEVNPSKVDHINSFINRKKTQKIRDDQNEHLAWCEVASLEVGK